MNYYLLLIFYYREKKSIMEMYKKKVLKKVVLWVDSGPVTGQSVFALGKKILVWVKYFSDWVGSRNSNPFCHV